MTEYAELIKTIRRKIEELPSLKEANIRTHIVVDTFLNAMGFSPDKWDYEENIYDKFTDLIYLENKKSIFVVETKGQSDTGKKRGSDLSENDINQICGYLHSHEPQVTWGLLTNGSRYILINNSIKGNVTDKVVFDISISSKTNTIDKLLKYFSYEHLFVDMTANYFADIAQFKAYRGEDETTKKNWNVYKSALYKFFDFYAEQHPYKSYGDNFHEPLSQVRVDDFKYYINARLKNESGGKQVSSKETIKNSYSYISSFFITLAKKGYIQSHNFKYARNTILSDFEETPKIKDENFLTSERYELILDFLSENQNTYRNIAIFLLCSYYGLERSDVST